MVPARLKICGDFFMEVRFMKNRKANWIVKVAMLGAVATVLMLFEFPIPFIAPNFYELDFSEVPVLVGGFAMGPLAGVAIEAVKILLNFLINGTITGGVGEFSNFVLGAIFVFPAAIIYQRVKTRKGAVIGLATGGILMVILGVFTNAFIMLPLYSKMMPLETILGMAAAIWPAVDSVFDFVLLCVVPFNIVKAILVSVITVALYKRLSPLLKK